MAGAGAVAAGVQNFGSVENYWGGGEQRIRHRRKLNRKTARADRLIGKKISPKPARDADFSTSALLHVSRGNWNIPLHASSTSQNSIARTNRPIPEICQAILSLVPPPSLLQTFRSADSSAGARDDEVLILADEFSEIIHIAREKNKENSSIYAVHENCRYL
jgi:hypothetical protein